MLALLRRIETDLDVLGKRTLTALALALLVGGSIFAGPAWGPALVLAILVTGGAWEWSGLAVGAGRAPPAAAARIGYVLAIVAAMAGAWWAVGYPAARAVVWTAAGGWWLVAAVWVLRRSLRAPQAGPEGAAPGTPGPETDDGGRHIPAPLTALAGMLSLVPAWLALASVHVASPTPWPLLLIIALVVAADMGAYFTGRLMGRHQLSPRVSPGKTWEGLAGGLAGALAVGVVAALAPLPLPPGVVPAALVIALVSVLGDLTVSLFKRHAGVKHSGNLLPGHGGVLDRIDSFCSAAPVFAAWVSLTTDWL